MRRQERATHLAKRDEDGLEEDLGLEQAFLERLVEVDIQPLVLGNVVPHTRQHHQVKESVTC